MDRFGPTKGQVTEPDVEDLSKSGVEFEVTSDAPTEFLDNAISRGVDGLMFAANDPVAISPVLRKALKAGIPVIGVEEIRCLEATLGILRIHERAVRERSKPPRGE